MNNSRLSPVGVAVIVVGATKVGADHAFLRTMLECPKGCMNGIKCLEVNSSVVLDGRLVCWITSELDAVCQANGNVHD